jgi:hypothetical protein
MQPSLLIEGARIPIEPASLPLWRGMVIERKNLPTFRKRPKSRELFQ